MGPSGFTCFDQGGHIIRQPGGFKIEKTKDAVHLTEGLQKLSGVFPAESPLLVQPVDVPDDGENGGQGTGYIQVVVHGLGKPVADVVNQLIQIRVAAAAAYRLKIVNTAVQPAEGLFRRRKSCAGEDRGFAVMGRQQPESNGPSGNALLFQIRERDR